MSTLNPVLYAPRVYGGSEYSVNPDPQSFSVTLSDSASMGDALADNLSKVLADLTTLTESQITIVTQKVLSDSFTMSDAKAITAIKALAETLGTSDAAVLNALKALSESTTLTESRTFDVNKVLADATTMSETASLSALKSFAEALDISESAIFRSTKALTDFIVVKEWVSLRLLRASPWQVGGPNRAIRPHFYGPVRYAENMYSTNIAVLWVDGTRSTGSSFTNLDGHKYNY